MKEPGSLETPFTLTEQRNPLSEDIDVRSSLEIVELINHEDREVAQAVYEARASIATVIDWVAEAFRNKGHLFYVGAGTSGRLGVLDAAESPPTFGVSRNLVQAIIAGGAKALHRSVEGAEDDVEAGKQDLAKRDVTDRDVVVGISSGSTTPYVRGAIKEARKRGAKTVLLTCTPLTERGDFADLVITLMTGPEVLTGSTRMKAGTATKMALNTISTGAMIRTGRTYGNLMVDLACSNRKLVQRGLRIIHTVTQLSEKKARQLLRKADKHVKTALAMGVLGIDRAEAEKLLKDNHGFLRALFKWPHKKNPNIDAVIFDMDGTILQYALPTGFSTWAALGWAFGIYTEMEDWVDQYLAGDIHYMKIWENCAQHLQGQPVQPLIDVFFPVAGEPPYSRGFIDCVNVLRGKYRLGILSSGISIVAREIKSRLALDFEISNHFGSKQGIFDGTVDVNVPFDHKIETLKKLSKKLNVPLQRICFVGDSLNDLETLKAVGLPVAYNPKTPEVAKTAKGNVIGDFLQLPRLIETYKQRTRRTRRTKIGEMLERWGE